MIGKIGGWFLIAAAGLASCGAPALMINSTFQRRDPLLPRA